MKRREFIVRLKPLKLRTSKCFPVCARKLPILELLPPPALGERRHRRLARRLVVVVGDMVEEPAHSLYL